MRCVVGERCWIVASKAPENIGKIVRITAPGFDWVCFSEGGPLIAWWSNDPSRELHTRGPIMFCDGDLHPIRPTDAPDEVTRVVPVGEPEGVSA